MLLDFVDQGYDVYEVVYEPPPEIAGGLFAGLPSSSTTTDKSSSGVGGWRGLFRSVICGVVTDVKVEVMAVLNDMNSVERR